MTLAERLQALQEAFTGKSAEVDAKAAEVTSLTEKVASIEAVVGEKSAALAVATAKIEELTKALAEAEAIRAKAESQAAEILASQETAGKKAAALAAEVGVQPVEVAPGEAVAQAKSDEEIAQEWASLKQKDAKAASDYYTKHRTAILRAAGLR